MFPEPKRKHVSFKIKGFFVQDETEFYVDKRCAYMYKSKLTQCLLEVNQKKKKQNNLGRGNLDSWKQWHGSCQILKQLSYLSFLMIWMNMCVCMCTWVQIPSEFGRKCPVLWIYKCSWATWPWILGIELKSSVRTVRTLKPLSHLSRPHSFSFKWMNLLNM